MARCFGGTVASTKDIGEVEFKMGEAQSYILTDKSLQGCSKRIFLFQEKQPYRTEL